MPDPRTHCAMPATALLTILGLAVVAAATLSAALGQSAPSVGLTGGADGAYFSVMPGFNVAGIEVTAEAGSPVQRFTARADGDGSTTAFDLTDTETVIFEGDVQVTDETPTGTVNGTNRWFAPLQTLGDSGIAGDNQPDGFWSGDDIVVKVDGMALPLNQYGVDANYTAGTVRGAGADSLTAGDGVGDTVHVQDPDLRQQRPRRDAHLVARLRNRWR